MWAAVDCLKLQLHLVPVLLAVATMRLAKNRRQWLCSGGREPYYRTPTPLNALEA